MRCSREGDAAAARGGDRGGEHGQGRQLHRLPFRGQHQPEHPPGAGGLRQHALHRRQGRLLQPDQERGGQRQEGQEEDLDQLDRGRGEGER